MKPVESAGANQRMGDQISRKLSVLTSTLFASPSFMTGYARALDVAGTFDSYNGSDSAAEADGSAIAQDWMVVGSQMSEAMNTYE